MIITQDSIYKAGFKLLLPLSLKTTYKIIVNEAIKLAGADSGIILLKSKTGWNPVYISNGIRMKKGFLARRNGYTYKAYKEQKIIIVKTKILRKIKPLVSKQGYNKVLILPIFHEKKTKATIVLMYNKDKKIENINYLKLFSQLSSLAIKKNQLLIQSKKAIESRDLFISIASHELKTPLTVVKAYAQLIQKKLETNKSPDIQWIKELTIASNKLAKLINELLQVEQIKKRQLIYNKRKLALTQIVKNSINSAKLNYPNHKFIFNNKLSTMHLIYADYDKISEAIINLLNNAAKFSLSQSIISINLNHNSDHYLLSIKDQGKGISKENMKRVFDPFYKGSNYTEGMGIGLFLVQKIINKHNGSINIKSALNKGTTIEIKFPKYA